MPTRLVWGLVLALAGSPVFGPGAHAYADPAFVEGFEDLPLMPALTQEPGSVTVFDSPYGRIVESYASGRADRAAVLAFYAATLPQLGWVRADEASFRREGEVLTLDVTQDGTAVTVRFQVSPTG